MTSKLNALLALLALLFSCKAEQISDSAILKIILTNDKAELLVNKYVYLVDVSKKSVVDSALVKGDTVIFSKHCNPSFVPYMVSVDFIDTFQGHPYLLPMGLRNPYVAKSIYSIFYLDKGITILKPYLISNDNEESVFIGSKQNEPYLKHVELQYAGESSIDRVAIIGKNISKIKSYPYSIHLVEQLFYYKEKFSNQDLKNQLSFFDDDIKNTALFKSFNEYFSTSSTYDKAFPLIKLESQTGKYQKIGSDSAAYYLIVYWASWCGPCRKEIPVITELYNKFTNRGLSITSISIDGEKRNWQAAFTA